MKLRLLSFLLLGIAHLSVYGQRLHAIDSLLREAAWPQAEAEIRRELTRFPQHVGLQNRRAQVLIARGNFSAADSLLRRLEGSGSTTEQAITQTTIGFLHMNRGRNDLAIEAFEKAQAGFRSGTPSETLDYAQCLAYLSFAYGNSGMRNQAEEAGLIALQIRERLAGARSEAVAASYNDLGVLYGATDPDRALSYYEMARDIYARNHPADHPKLAVASTNIGFAYNRLELYGDAITNFETALSIWKKQFPNGHPNIGVALVNLALTYNRLNNTKAALSYLDQALLQYQNAYGAKHPDIASALNQKAIIVLAQQKYSEAIQIFQAAMVANARSFQSQAESDSPEFEDAFSAKVLYYSLSGKAQALEGRHFGKTLRFRDLQMALATLEKCDDLIDYLRQRINHESDKIELGEQASEVYAHGVRLALIMSDLTPRGRPYREKAFYFAEKSKAAVLADLLADSQAKSFAGIPDELLEQERELKAQITWIAQKLAAGPPPQEEDQYRAQLFDLNAFYKTFIQQLEKDYPDYYNLKFNASIPTVGDIQARIPRQTAFISYFYSDSTHQLFQFILTPGKFTARTVRTSPQFNGHIRGFVNALYYRDPDLQLDYSQRVSHLVVPRLPRAVRHLIVLPSPNLSTTPFEALLTRRARTPAPFVLLRYSVAYEFSAGLFLQKQMRTPSAANPSLFVCAPIRFPSSTYLPSLPGTAEEAAQLQQLFGDSAARILLREQADEQTIKSGMLSEYRYLHFATHGMVDADRPELSRLHLLPRGPEDGVLYAGEIYNLALDADLVVLSACQTGLGKVSRGEGVIGLSRALAYAGARNSLVSFWSVADQSTATLMVDFYRQILKSKSTSFAEALRQAKLRMLHSEAYREPYYWAPFVLIGQ